MRILVTGSAGFIGSAVCEALRSRGMTPVSFDGASDVRDRAAVQRAMVDADGVINLAGILGTSEMFGAEYEAAGVNILGALNVMDAAWEVDVPMVQIATGHEGQPNPYAITKKCTTDLCLARAQWKGQRINVVRAFHAYGPGQKMCAPHGKSKVRKIIPSFVARALTGMPLEINGSGNQKVDLVYVDDVAKTLVDGLLCGKFGQILDAGTGKASRVIDIAHDVIRACESKSGVMHVPMRHGEPEESCVVALEPQCRNPFPYKLQDTVAWYAQALKVWA